MLMFARVFCYLFVALRALGLCHLLILVVVVVLIVLVKEK